MRVYIKSLYLISLLILICSIIIVDSTEIIIENENDLINSINDASGKNEIIFNVNDKEIEIFNNIQINNIKKISITGKSKDTSSLKFNDISNGLFFNNVNSIEFFNLTIDGYLYFESIRNLNIEDVNINGAIDFHETKENLSLNILINHLIYHAVISEKKYNCINIYGLVEINNSTFFGSPSCEDSLLNYNGENQNNLNITYSHFDGAYSNNCLSVSNSLKTDIGSCIFENGGAYINGGGAIRSINTILNVNNTDFINNFSSSNGGVLYIYDSDVTKVNNCNAYNSTAIERGCFIYMTNSHDYEIMTYIYNITQSYTGFSSLPIKSGGLIASVEGFSSLYINNFYGEYFNAGNGGSAFIMNDKGKINIENIMLQYVMGNSKGGVLLRSISDYIYSIYYEPSEFSVDNGYFTDFYQNYKKDSALFIYTETNTKIKLTNCYIYNINGRSSNFIYSYGLSIIIIDNVTIDRVGSDGPSSLFKNVKYSNHEDSILDINSLTVTNYNFIYSIISYDNGEINVRNSMFNQMQGCSYSYLCTGKIKLEYEIINNKLINIGINTTINIKNSTFTYIFSDNFFNGKKNSTFIIEDSVIADNYILNSILCVDSSSDLGLGQYTINNVEFSSNIAYYGTILNILEMDSNTQITFNNSSFYYNNGIHYGGIVYSISSLTNLYVVFNNCKFSNNYSSHGVISFSYSKSSEPYFSNIDDLRNIQDSFGTNPTKLVLTPDSIDHFSFVSGGIVTGPIKFKILDDYDYEYSRFIDLINYSEITDIMYFKVDINDTYNAAVIGQTISYCLNDYCEVPNVKVVGNPGNYKLQMRIISNQYYIGRIANFPGNLVEVDITIEECDETKYLNQDIENIGLKSCYLPKCNPSCNGGICVNNNVCNCTNTLYTGLHCNEYYKLESSNFMKILYKIISLIIIITAFIFIIGVLYYRNNQIIKAASYDFLILILIGIISNGLYILTLSFDKTTSFICLVEYFYKNMGFSIIYGSVLVKTYRIYIIFNITKKKFYGIRKKKMISIVLLIMILHISLILYWYIKKSVKPVLKYTSLLREYNNCAFPSSENLSEIINLIVIFLASILTYVNRYVDKKYQEYMAIPVYSYILVVVLETIIKYNSENIEINLENIFRAGGTLIYTSVTLYYIYIKKFQKILTRDSKENNISRVTVFLK